VKTRSLYLTWPWISTGSWQTDRQTERIPTPNTRSQQYLPVQLARVKSSPKCWRLNRLNPLSSRCFSNIALFLVFRLYNLSTFTLLLIVVNCCIH